ncbi:uncharacterized protein LOC134070116 isoform X2 [Sardina pilchardus]|uniref:uncharacterized protein LOC134070116 isoform X2 n=1 Tax=Sardina pilchardus TaxID=27697 RepID=UPI002E124995
MKEEEVEPIPKEQQKDTDGEEDNNLPQSEMKEEEVEPIPKEQQKDTDGEEDKYFLDEAGYSGCPDLTDVSSQILPIFQTWSYSTLLGSFISRATAVRFFSNA